MCASHPHCPVLQPQGITLARIDGPTTDDVTMRESGECEITPSTDVKYPQDSITALHNQWLLIGAGLHTVMGAALLCSYSSQLSAFLHPRAP